jgi:transcriptional regulator with XRE-family HTH domain
MQTPSRDKILRDFGRALVELRGEAGLSQEQLADAAGLHRTYIGGLERAERNPTVVTLIALSKGLGISASGLLSRAGL